MWWRPQSIGDGGTFQEIPFYEKLVGPEPDTKEELLPKIKDLRDKFEDVLKYLNWDISSVEKASWISNPRSAALFEAMRKTIEVQHAMNPIAFNDQKRWKRRDPEGEGETVLEELRRRRKLVEANFGNVAGGTRPVVMPFIQGTFEDAGKRISENGFGTVSSLDAGWYGQGIYFTSRPSYAKIYSKKGVFLISLILPGNSCPVVEDPFTDSTRSKKNPLGLLGGPCEPGYQSHYVVVPNKWFAFPARFKEGEQFDPKKHADELVVFNHAQTLPLFLVYSSSPKETFLSGRN